MTAHRRCRVEECPECGHLHWCESHVRFFDCPQSDFCECLGQPPHVPEEAPRD